VVAANSTLNALGVEADEPHGLAKVEALAADLEEQPLLEEKLFGGVGQRQEVSCVVGLDEVLDDGARLPPRDAGVGVGHGGHAAVGVDVLVGRRVQDGHVEDPCSNGNPSSSSMMATFHRLGPEAAARMYVVSGRRLTKRAGKAYCASRDG
jgi:hypothetical protein